MIIAVNGGLGNQFFQYAFGRALEEKYCIRVEYDVSALGRKGRRKCGLDLYNIKWKKCSIFLSNIFKIIIKLKADDLFKVFGERNLFEYDVIRPGDWYIYGNWQNVNYFKHIRTLLLQELTYKYTLNNIQDDIKRKIIEGCSIAIHVRRGDYLLYAEEYYLMEMNYYERAISYFRNKYENSIFYIFSDDMEWCKENFKKYEECVFIDRKISDSPYIDFELMRCCKHFIIANSTFSWWASWLSEDKEKEMIAPELWFKNEHDQSKVKEALLKEYMII